MNEVLQHLANLQKRIFSFVFRLCLANANDLHLSLIHAGYSKCIANGDPLL